MSLAHKYIPLVDFLSQALGPNFEVVLHDVSVPDSSIIAIGNNHISKRQVGGPVTDLALKIVKAGLKDNQDFIVNYNGRLGNGNITRSSTYFIKNDQGEIEGALCINLNITPLLEIKDYLKGLVDTSTHNTMQQLETPAANNLETAVEVFENLHETIDDVIHAIIDKVLFEFPVTPERMSADEKIEVVKKLNEHGLFLLKGGLSAVATSMNVSEATIYRYLNKVKA